MCVLGAWQDCSSSGHNEEIAVLVSLSFLMCKLQITTLASWDLCEVWIKYQVTLLALVKVQAVFPHSFILLRKQE